MNTQLRGIAASAPNACLCDWPGGCVCDVVERALRAFGTGKMPPMTQQQRDECVTEIERVGYSTRLNYQDATDAVLANGVRASWAWRACEKLMPPREVSMSSGGATTCNEGAAIRDERRRGSAP